MRHIKALLILLYILGIGFMSIPRPVRGVQAKLVDNPDGHRDVEAWAEAARSLGLEARDTDVVSLVARVAGSWARVRSVIAEPIGPFFTYTGTRQSWRMFSKIRHHKAALSVSLDQGDGYEPLFIANQDERWLTQKLRQERTRAVLSSYSSLKGHGSWEGFVDWLAAEAAKDFPSGSKLRVELLHTVTPPPKVMRNKGAPEPSIKRQSHRVLP